MSLEADEKKRVAMDTLESRGTGECIAPFTNFLFYFTFIFLIDVFYLFLTSGF